MSLGELTASDAFIYKFEQRQKDKSEDEGLFNFIQYLTMKHGQLEYQGSGDYDRVVRKKRIMFKTS